MTGLIIKVVSKEDTESPFPELAQLVHEDKMVLGTIEKAALLEKGTQQGKTSLALKVVLSDGKVALVEVLPGLFEGLYAAFQGAKQRFGT